MKRVLLVFGLLALTGCGFEVVDTGYRGVQTNFGKIVGEPLDEGIHLYNPLTHNIIELPVREQKFEHETTAYTQDVQQASFSYTVNYYPDSSKIHILYQTLGRDWAEKILPQKLEGALKAVVGRYDAVELVSNRAAAVTEINDMVKVAFKDTYVIIKNLEVVNIDFNDSFESAVEAKVVAIQKAEEAKNKTVQIKEEAEQKVIAAKAEAESMKIRSEALSQNKSLVEYEAVQKWDGKLPTYMMGNSVPFINLTKQK